jgi:hypothetical protein
MPNCPLFWEKFLRKMGNIDIMKEVPERGLRSRDDDLEECYSIAESMLEVIHSINSTGRYQDKSSNGRHKGTLKRLLMRQIKTSRHGTPENDGSGAKRE